MPPLQESAREGKSVTEYIVRERSHQLPLNHNRYSSAVVLSPGPIARRIPASPNKSPSKVITFLQVLLWDTKSCGEGKKLTGPLTHTD